MFDRTTETTLPNLLFAYGTLLPSEPERRRRDGWEADAVRGRLFDLGPYPGLIDLDKPDATWVEGYVRPVTIDEIERRLDPYEGVDERLFRRERTTTRGGRWVWIYVYARPLPEWAQGPLARWEAGGVAWSIEEDRRFETS